MLRESGFCRSILFGAVEITHMPAFRSSPCVLVAILRPSCQKSAYTLPALSPGYHYSANGVCTCNIPIYNLESACGACRGGEWLSVRANASVEVECNCSPHARIGAGRPVVGLDRGMLSGHNGR